MACHGCGATTSCTPYVCSSTGRQYMLCGTCAGKPCRCCSKTQWVKPSEYVGDILGPLLVRDPSSSSEGEFLLLRDVVPSRVETMESTSSTSGLSVGGLVYEDAKLEMAIANLAGTDGKPLPRPLRERIRALASTGRKFGSWFDVVTEVEKPVEIVEITTAPLQRRGREILPLLLEALGLELETSIDIKASPLTYQQLVYEKVGAKWKITADGVQGGSGYLEIVTKPLGTYEQLKTVMLEICTFVAKLAQVAGVSNWVSLPEMIKAMGEPWTSYKSCLVCQIAVREAKKKPSMTRVSLGTITIGGSPQVTCGVPLHRMIQFLRRASNVTFGEYELQGTSAKHRLYTPHTLRWPTSDVQDPLEVAAKWVKVIKAQETGIPEIDIERAGGLLALVLQYLNEGFYGPRGQRVVYAKSCFSVLCRTNFHAMYQTLGKAKKLFTLDTVKLLWVGTNTYDVNTKYVIPGGFKEVTDKKLEYTAYGPTIAEWIESIISPSSKLSKTDRLIMELYKDDPDILPHVKKLGEKDLLSRDICAYNSISMGLLPMVEVNGCEVVLIEFREWPEEALSHYLWQTFAEKLFVFYASALTEGVEVVSFD